MSGVNQENFSLIRLAIPAASNGVQRTLTAKPCENDMSEIEITIFRVSPETDPEPQFDKTDRLLIELQCQRLLHIPPQ